MVLWGLIAVVGNTFQCWSVQYFWIKYIRVHYMAGQDAFFTKIRALSMVQDVLILCLSIPGRVAASNAHAPESRDDPIVLGRVPVRLSQPGRVASPPFTPFSCIVYISNVLRVIELRHYQTDNLSCE